MALDYANERYVLLYTRDTATWKLLDWEARAVLMFLLRKVDRAGVLDVGDDGLEGLAAVIEVPIEVVARAMPKLTARQTVVDDGASYALPNFLDAQETARSDKQRQRDSREKRRAGVLSRSVTDRHTRSQPVTCGHAESQPVTPILPSPGQSSPDSLSGARGRANPAQSTEPDEPPTQTCPAASRPPITPLVTLAVELLNAARLELDPTAQPIDADQGDEMAAAGHLRTLPEDRRESAIRHGVAAMAASVKAGRDTVGILRPGELFGPRSWRKWQAAPTESTPRGRDGPAGKPRALGQAHVSPTAVHVDGDQAL